jgi:AcrR family transcriptional regulator
MRVRQRLAGEERSRSIVAATLGLFARRGFTGVTSREIARAAGVSEALVFKHFPDKNCLYRAILQAKIEESERSLPLDESLRALDDEGFFLAIVLDVMRRVENDDTFLRLLLRSAMEGHDLAREFRRARIDKVRALIEHRIRERYGRRRQGDVVDPALAARVFTGMISASLLSRHIFNEPVLRHTSIERWARTLVRVFLHGIGGAGGEREAGA